ncbi:MAG TPA: hypothetical protein VHZ51_16135 [Ktedonobacteraceae bacterium]|jgi:hypothetical protein|nr:hypothetical protein [Ktedonobacteraceae bacterium]
MGINVEASLVEMSLSSLSERCIQEMRKYRSKEPSDDRYCLEVLRRAVIGKNDAAWAVLRQQFHESIRLWFARHPYREAALRHETSEQSFIDDTFRRFWQAVGDQALLFSSAAGVYSYLHMCLNCSIMDTLRAYARPKEESLFDGSRPDELLLMEDAYHEDELWEVMKSVLPGERERRVAYLLFHCNLKPREIVRFCAREFQSEGEIYRLKRNIMERVSRNSDRIKWCLSSTGN